MPRRAGRSGEARRGETRGTGSRERERKGRDGAGSQEKEGIMEDAKQEKAGALPEWFRGKGEEALRFLYGVMCDEAAKPDARIAIAKLFVEYELGKPGQQAGTEAPAPGPADGMSLSERGAAMRAAIEAYESCGK